MKFAWKFSHYGHNGVTTEAITGMVRCIRFNCFPLVEQRK
jgi:hypothetical protein